MCLGGARPFFNQTPSAFFGMCRPPPASGVTCCEAECKPKCPLSMGESMVTTHKSQTFRILPLHELLDASRPALVRGMLIASRERCFAMTEWLEG